MNGAGTYRLGRRVRARLFTLMIRRSFAAWGLRSVAAPPLRLEGERDITIGAGTWFGSGCWLNAIGDHDHAFTDPGRPARRQDIANAAPVMIGDGAWLGHNVTVTAGVSIGRGAVIAAGAVMTRDVPPYSLAVGVPARVARLWAPVTAHPSCGKT